MLLLRLFGPLLQGAADSEQAPHACSRLVTSLALMLVITIHNSNDFVDDELIVSASLLLLRSCDKLQHRDEEPALSMLSTQFIRS